ncbi:MAG: type II secretion system protein [Nitrospirae bacterium]|nr:type II secretion system protein [Nitrospirota bacterium]
MADRSKSGFTLLEITISVAIMVLIVTVVFPQVGDIAKVQLNTTARRLIGATRHTCFQALLTKKDYVFNYDLDKNEYWIGEIVLDLETKMTTQKEVKRGLGRRRKLPPGITFKAIELADGKSATKGEALTRFLHNGMNDRTVIELMDGKNRETCITIPSSACGIKPGCS